MSWTSEFEPTTPRAATGDADLDELLFQTTPDPEPPPDDDLPDGPLDPSLFDGLFADLGDDSDASDGEPDTHDDDDARVAQDDELVDQLVYAVDEDTDLLEPDADAEVADLRLEPLPDPSNQVDVVDQPDDGLELPDVSDLLGELERPEPIVDEPESTYEPATADIVDVDPHDRLGQDSVEAYEPSPYHDLDPQSEDLLVDDHDAFDGRPVLPAEHDLDADLDQPYTDLDPDPDQPLVNLNPDLDQPYADFDPDPDQPLVDLDADLDQPNADFDPDLDQPLVNLDPDLYQPYADHSHPDHDIPEPIDPALGEAVAFGTPHLESAIVESEHFPYPDQHLADEVALSPTAVPYEAPDAPPSDRSSRWRAFLAATLIGAGLGIGGAVVLATAVFGGDDPAPTEAVDPGIDQGAPDEAGITDANGDAVEAGGAGPVTTMADAAADGVLELTSVRFQPGTTTLTPASKGSLEELATVASENPGAPLTVAVRTYSETTATLNRELSDRQAEAIVEFLVAQGADPATTAAMGLGSPPLSTTQPVANFVAVRPGFGQRRLAEAVTADSPFTVGIDPVTGQLRFESIDALNTIGEAMAADQSATISLAGYAYRADGNDLNRALAAEAVDATTDYLTSSYDIGPDRIEIVNVGEAPYIVGPEVGSHVSVQWGDRAAATLELSGVDQAGIAFAAGSAEVDDQMRAVLDELATIADGSDTTFIIDVHTYSETTGRANAELSDAQAAAIADYLTSLGLDDDEVRVHGSGDLRQFRSDDRASRVVITAVPAI